MHGFFSIWDYIRGIVELLLILSYGGSVAAFVIGLKRAAGRLPGYFSGLFFLALCPFLILFLAAAIRLAPIVRRIDELANAQQALSDAIAPLYLGVVTSLSAGHRLLDRLPAFELPAVMSRLEFRIMTKSTAATNQRR